MWLHLFTACLEKTGDQLQESQVVHCKAGSAHGPPGPLSSFCSRDGLPCLRVLTCHSGSPSAYIQALRGLSGRCVCTRHSQRKVNPEAGEKDHFPQSGFLEAEAAGSPGFLFPEEAERCLLHWGGIAGPAVGDRKGCISAPGRGPRLRLGREKPAWIPASPFLRGSGCLRGG